MFLEVYDELELSIWKSIVLEQGQGIRKSIKILNSVPEVYNELEQCT